MSADGAHLEKARKRVPTVERQYWKPFGEWLRQCRTEKRLSRERAAHLAGITLQHWAKIENGATGTTPATLTLLAEAVSADPREAYRQCGLSDRETVINSVRSRMAGVRAHVGVTAEELRAISQELEKTIRRLTRQLDAVNRLIARQMDG